MLLFASSCALLKYLAFAPILNVLKVKMLCSWLLYEAFGTTHRKTWRGLRMPVLILKNELTVPSFWSEIIFKILFHSRSIEKKFWAP